MEVTAHKGFKEANVLFLDIETAPNLGWIWGKYEQNVIEFQSEWYILSFAAKWLGERTFALNNTHGENDKILVTKLWHLLDDADIVVAHNGDKFDLRKINSRFAFHLLPPPSPYKTVDTLKVARKYYAFNSNKLDDLGATLGLGRKEKHNGFETWKGCMQGNSKSWKEMLKYNANDVELLEKIFFRFFPWIRDTRVFRGINVSLLNGKR